MSDSESEDVVLDYRAEPEPTPDVTTGEAAGGAGGADSGPRVVAAPVNNSGGLTEGAGSYR